MKKVLLVAILVLVVLVGCEETSPMEPLPQLNNDLVGGKLVLQSRIAGFDLIREYSTSYNASEWRITDSKTLKMSVHTSGADGTSVLIEHVHIDVNLQSTYASFDGWLQDSMDDSFHGDQGGFWIADNVPYENIFAIEGFSQTLIDGWIFLWGSYGSGGIHEYRLTENNLVEYGKVYGNKFSIIYDVLVRKAGEQYFHVYCVADEFLIPVKTQ